ncbi:hypothetical protein [Paraburkholderia youngii]|uniref:hypothetical protein n=1 Tax=Paraburkholderia youngii TaxID=2782701 RepID=UPI003D20F36D
MDLVLTPAAYPFSRDYKRLAALAREASVVCFVDYYFRGVEGVMRDVARTSYRRIDGLDLFEVCARGTGYVSAHTEDDFVKRCEAANLEFIDPATFCAA